MKTNRLLFIHTSMGKLESIMTVEEAVKEITEAKKENRLAVIEKPENKASLGDGIMVDNKAIIYLDLNEIKVYSYEDNTFTQKEEKDTKKDKKEKISK